MGKAEGAPHAVVRNQDLFLARDSAQAPLDHYATSFTGEDEITTALMRLREGKKHEGRVHDRARRAVDERLESAGPRDRQLEIAVQQGRLRGHRPESDQDEIPQDLSLLIVVGPNSPFKPDELLKIRSFTDRGKPLLLLLGNTAPSGLDDLLKSFNLSIGKGVVVDRRYNLNGNSRAFPMRPSTRLTSTRSSRRFGPNRAVLLPGAAPIQIAGVAVPKGQPTQPENPDLVPTAISDDHASLLGRERPQRRRA